MPPESCVKWTSLWAAVSRVLLRCASRETSGDQFVPEWEINSRARRKLEAIEVLKQKILYRDSLMCRSLRLDANKTVR